MAKIVITGIPNYVEKQKILYVQKTSPEQLASVSDLLMQEDRLSEAWDYLERTNDDERVRKFMEESKRRGDFFNFDRAARNLGVEVSAKEWEELGEIALRQGLILNAVESFRRAGNKNKAKQIIASNPDFFGPVLEMDRLKRLSGEVEEEEGDDEEKEEDSDEEDDEYEEDEPLGVSILKKIEEGARPEDLELPEKDADQAAKDALAKARKKKWKQKKK